MICNRIDDCDLENNINVKVIPLQPGILKSLRGISSLLSRLNTDIIHVHSYKSLNPFFVTYGKRKHNIPIVFTPHYHPMGNHPKIIRKFFDITIGGYSLKKADKVIVLTPHEKKMIERLGCPYNIDLLPNPFDTVRKDVKDEEITQFKDKWNIKSKNILYIGRLAKHKGLDILIKAFQNVTLKYENVSLLIVGEDDGMYPHIDALKKKLNLTSVILTGKLSNHDLVKSYLSSDIMVLPSSYEAFGMVLLEAMSYGVAVIGTNVGGIPYVLQDGECGKIVKYGDVEQLSNTIRELLFDDSIRLKLIENGYKRIHDFSIKTISEKLENIYQSLCVEDK